MSRKSRHIGKSKVYIKYIRNLTEDEFKNSPLFKSIVDAMAGGGTGSDGWRLNIATPDGELATKRFKEISYGKDAFKDSFSEEYTLAAVKIVYSDGTEDYGFKHWKADSIVNRKNAILENLFIRDGIWSEGAGEFVECPKNVLSTRKLPAWLVKKIPTYNEKVRAAAFENAEDCYRSRDPNTVEEAVCKVIDSSMVSRYAVYGKPPTTKGPQKFKCAYRVASAYPAFDEQMEMGWYNEGWNTRSPYSYTYFKKNFPVEYSFIPNDGKHQPINYDDFARYIETSYTNAGGWYVATSSINVDEDELKRKVDDINRVVVYQYTYLKSVYKDSVSTRKVYKVVPMSDILTIEKMNYWGDHKPVEVWNNLDQTVKGNM